MERKSATNYSVASRIGFHYFPDSLHYREKDLNLWLPRLKELKAAYLVLNSPTNRAIPEEFISALNQAKITPVINFNLPLSQDVPWGDLETLMRSYGRWGARYALLNQRPNSQAAWGEKYWNQPNLVEAHTKQFIDFGNMALNSGIRPIFSPLVPGGNYWDLAFLTGALNMLSNSAGSLLIRNMTLSAYAWDFGKSLDWGSGGSKVWQDVKPYKVPKNSQDQRGFRAYEWYDNATQSILGKSLPVMLFQAGINSDPLQSSTKSITPDTARQQLIYRLLRGENVYDPDNSAKLLSAISPKVLACNFYLLSDDNAKGNPNAWFASSGTPHKTARGLLRKYNMPVQEKQPAHPAKRPASVKAANPQFKYGRYVLVAKSLRPRIQEILKTMHAYISRYKPVVGFSCEEAKQAAYILVIAYENDFPEKEIQHLQENGNLVRLIKPEAMQASI